MPGNTTIDYIRKQDPDGIALIREGKRIGLEITVGSSYLWHIVSQGKTVHRTVETDKAFAFVQGYAAALETMKALT